MPQELITQLLNDLESFHQASEQELESLRADGLLPVERYELVKSTAYDLLKPLQPILSKAQTVVVPEATVVSLVDRYKTFMTQQLGELYRVAYSSKYLKQRMRDFVQTHISEISARIRAERDAMPFLRSVLTQIDHVKVIKATIDDLQARLIYQFEIALQKDGDAQRISLFQDALEQFEEGMCQIVDSYFMDQDSSKAINDGALRGNVLLSVGQGEPSPIPAATNGSSTILEPTVETTVNQMVETTEVDRLSPVTSIRQLHHICQEATTLASQLRTLSKQSDRIAKHLQALLAEAKNLAK